MTRSVERTTSRRVPVRTRSFSRRLDVRLLVVCGGAVVIGIVATALSVSVGEFPIPLRDVAATLVGAGTRTDEFIIVGLRLPRALVGLGCGMALGVSGLIFQTLVRNPLAAPDVIGVTGGASLTGVAVLILGAPPALLPVGAFAGAVASATLVYALAWRGGLSPYRLVLVGIALAAAFAAGTSYLLVVGELIDVQRAAVWLVGSLNGVTWEEFWPLVAGLVVLFPATAALTRALDALSLGEESSVALGVDVSRARLALVVVAAALAAFAVAAAGPIGFVAFIAPHIARRLTGLTGAAVLPAAALVGGVLVMVCDLVARVVLAPVELPVGTVTAVVGAPFFLYLLHRANRPVRGG
ncbi:FecCD family ABC transporter permease [Actinomycetospora rhizophila]|uniref:FecCD family ABC transporter permease n=1 Tax=Actinomycetospora rhizophila TaxID=1416876 RepID=A0ABV9ZL73_9PSEU